MGDGCAATVNTPLLPMFQKPVVVRDENTNNNATSHGRTVDLAATKLNDLYGGCNVLRLDCPEKFQWSSKVTCTTTSAHLDRRKQWRHQ